MKSLLKKFIPNFLLHLRLKIINKKIDEGYINIANCKEIFEKTYSSKIWGDGDFNSGSGSRNQHISDKYISSIKNYIGNNFHVYSAVDLGCGDFHIGSKIFTLFKSYIACDVVTPLIIKNSKDFIDDRLEFKNIDITNCQLPSGDIVFIRQVLQHLSNADIMNVLVKIENQKDYKFLVLTEHLPIGDFIANKDKNSGPGIRLGINSGVDITKSPFNFKYKKMKVICEVNEMGGIIKTIVFDL